VEILAVSGSLRRASSNTRLLLAAMRVAPADMAIVLHTGIGDLPPINPDLDDDDPPPPVRTWRALVKGSDGLLISSPEYAGGVPGVLKNALDWLVGSVDIAGKKVAVLNASPRATRAHESLLFTLSMISAHLVPEACIAVPLAGKKLHAAGIAEDPESGPPLRDALAALQRAIETSTSTELDWG